MTVLALDTATAATAVALCRPGAEPLEARDDPPSGARPRHAAALLPLAAGLLAEAGIGWTEIDRVAVGIGPGTFTGLRIGLATARGIAQARGTELVGVSTLASLAFAACGAARELGCEAVLAVIDARRREVFAAAWPVGAAEDAARIVRADTALLAPCALAPADLAAWIERSGRSLLAIGDGASTYRGVLETADARVPGEPSPLHRVSGRAHCHLAEHLAPAGDVRPDYIRAPDARPRTPIA